MSYRDDDDPFEEDIVFDQAGLLSTSRKSSKSAIRRVSSGKCATFSKTLGLCGAFLGLGLTVAIPGPLSPVPPSVLSHDISLMTYEVMYRCQGFMIGAMFGARLLDRFNRLFLVFLALLVTALLVTIIPWCGIAWLLRTDMFLLGVSFGFLTTGGNVLCLDLWGHNSGPFMQALHFSFSLGVFLAPFLSQPLMTSVNNPLPTPSTTLATFPLHRLPRDLSNTSVSSAGPTMIRQHPVSFPHILMNESIRATPASASNSPTPNDLGQILDHQPVMNQNASKLGKGTIQTPLIDITAQANFTGTSTSQATSAVSSVVPLNQSSSTSTVPTIPSHVPSNTSETSGVANLSSTTHRAPRPKPVLTNSDKLKDKMWENEKFRKPPPQDLVPISSTMRPMIQPDNKTTTGNSTSVTAMSSVMPKSNSISVTMNGAAVVLKSNSSLSTLQKPSAANPVPLKLDVSNSTLSKNLTENVSSSSNFFNPQNLSINISTSSATPPIDKVTHLTAATDLPSDKERTPSLMATASTSVKNISSSPVNDRNNYASKTNDGGKVMAMTADHLGGAAEPSQTPAKDYAKGSKMRLVEYTYKTEAVQSASTNSSSNDEEVKQHQSDLSLLLLRKLSSNNSSHSSEVNVFLNKQPLSALNSPATAPSIIDSRLQGQGIGNISFTSHQSKAMPATAKPSMDVDFRPLEVPWKSSQENNMQNAPEEKQSYSRKLGIMDDIKVSTEMSVSKISKESIPGLSLIPQPEKNAMILSEHSGNAGSPVSPKHTHHSKPASTVVNDTEVTHTVIDAFANRLEKYGLSRMELMYLTVGMVLLATSLLFLGFLCFNPRDPKSKTDDEEINGPITQSRNNGSCQTSVIPSRCLRHALIGLMILLLMITSGVQAMYGQLLLVYAIQSPLQIPQSTGTALTATFWGALTSTRFACILLASALSPTAMLILSVSICSCATWLLSAFSSSSEVALWIGSVMVSVGTASVFPSGMLWMQHHVLITHRVAAMLVMGPAMGEMFFPPLAYKMMVSLGPASLVHLPALLSLFAIALWAAVWRLARYPRPPLCSHVDESSGYQLANQNDEDDLVDLTMSPIVNGNGTISRNLVRSNGISHRMPYITT